MLIKTPESELVFFANAKKSDNVRNFPKFLNLGFRINWNFEYGLEITATMKKEKDQYKIIIFNENIWTNMHPQRNKIWNSNNNNQITKQNLELGLSQKKKKYQRNISVPFVTKFYLLKCKESKIKRMVPGKGHLRLVLFQEL